MKAYWFTIETIFTRRSNVTFYSLRNRMNVQDKVKINISDMTPRYPSNITFFPLGPRTPFNESGAPSP